MGVREIFGKSDPMGKRGVFITGAPRSGTSMITKVIDAHPDVAILMENIFQNRRRHWSKAEFWNSQSELKIEVGKVFSKIKESVIGNKVCTPDVWSSDDILSFCQLFKTFKIIFILRDPRQVLLSRYRREDYEAEFTDTARKNILLDFRNRFLTYTSSWRQSVESYWKLRDGYPSDVYIVYYEDFCQNFEEEAKRLFSFLELPFREEVLEWYKYPHHDRDGNLLKDLKYNDKPTSILNKKYEIQDDVELQINEALESIKFHYDIWKNRVV